MRLTTYFHDLPDGKKLEVCHARAVEWLCFPAVLSQSLIPIGYLFTRWYLVLGTVLAASLVWPLVRKPLASFYAATLGTTLSYARWPTIVAMASYLLYKREWPLALLTLCTTLIVWAISLPLISGKRELANDLTVRFMGQMGYVPDEEGISIP